MTHDLVKKAGRGVGWNIAAQIAQQAIKFLVIIILTRLLSPGDFGIFAMVLVFTEFIRPFREWGFQAAIIQKKNIDEEYQSMAFWAIAGLGVFLYFLSCFGASFVARFFKLPVIGQIIPVIALIFLMSPIGSIQWAMLTRELNFKLIAILDTVAMVFYGIAACSFALQGYGAWSLVLATLIRELSWSVMLWLAHHWRPLLRFNLRKFREILSFAANCMGTGVLTYGINNFDALAVGKFLGAASLGFYNLAFNTVSQPQSRIISQITGVIFPVYSLIKDEKERVQEAYLKTVKMVVVIAVPLVAVLFVVAKDFVLVLYGSKWLPAVLPIKIMCLYGLTRALTSVTSPVFLSQGRPDIEFKLTILRLIVFAASIVLGVQKGIEGVALAVLVFSLLNFFPTFYLSNRLLNVRFMDFYAIILKYVGFSLIVAMVLILQDTIYQKYNLQNHVLMLFMSVTVGLSLYLLMLRNLARKDFDYFLSLARRVIS